MKYSVHRISTQKALAIPEFAALKHLELATKELFLGRSDVHASVNRKNADRFSGNPATFQLNDYEKLLSLLFALSAERDRKHSDDTKQSQSYIPVPDAPIDTIGYL